MAEKGLLREKRESVYLKRRDEKTPVPFFDTTSFLPNQTTSVLLKRIGSDIGWRGPRMLRKIDRGCIGCGTGLDAR